jgi:hypothetical protein
MKKKIVLLVFSESCMHEGVKPTRRDRGTAKSIGLRKEEAGKKSSDYLTVL